MARDNELNELLNTLPRYLGDALARKDRKEQLKKAQEFQKEQFEYRKDRDSQQDLINDRNYKLKLAEINRDIISENRNAAKELIVAASSMVDDKSSIKEANQSLKIINEQINKTKDPHVQKLGEIIKNDVKERKSVLEDRQNFNKEFSNIVDKYVNILDVSKANKKRDMFTDPVQMSEALKTIVTNKDAAEKRQFSNIAKQYGQLENKVNHMINVRKFLEQHDKDKTLSTGFQTNTGNPQLNAVLKHINVLDKSGDWKGAYALMQEVGSIKSMSARNGQKVLSEMLNETKKEYMDTINSYRESYADYTKLPNVTLGKDTSPKDVAVLTAQDFVEFTSKYSEDLIGGDEILKKLVENYRKGKSDVSSKKGQENILKIANKIVERVENQTTGNRNGMDFKILGKGWNTAEAKAWKSMYMAYTKAAEYNNIINNSEMPNIKRKIGNKNKNENNYNILKKSDSTVVPESTIGITPNFNEAEVDSFMYNFSKNLGD